MKDAQQQENPRLQRIKSGPLKREADTVLAMVRIYFLIPVKMK